MVYTGGHTAKDKPRFQRVKAPPDRAELEQLVYTISERTRRYLERQGLLVRDLDNSYLALEPDETGLAGDVRNCGKQDIQQSSVNVRNGAQNGHAVSGSACPGCTGTGRSQAGF
jgi:hypothetical protein